jgi:hypothetical protein
LAITFGTIVPTFFCRLKPISRNMKPACMKKTRMAATITQVVSTAGITSFRVGDTEFLSDSGGRAGEGQPGRRK